MVAIKFAFSPHKYNIFFIKCMISYRELKFNIEKRKQFRRLLPYNYASLLFGEYKNEAIKQNKGKPKYSYSLIRKVASGERHNEQILKDLIAISKDFQRFLNTNKKYRKNGKTEC